MDRRRQLVLLLDATISAPSSVETRNQLVTLMAEAIVALVTQRQEGDDNEQSKLRAQD